MLYMPGIFGEDLMDRWFDDMDREIARMEKPLYGHNAKNLMRTDVREHDDSYEVDIELPGFHKDEVQLSLENGYLNITAAKGLDKDEKEEKEEKTGKLIRQERYAGSMSRSFYVGEDVTEEDIKANRSCQKRSILPLKANRSLDSSPPGSVGSLLSGREAASPTTGKAFYPERCGKPMKKCPQGRDPSWKGRIFFFVSVDLAAAL